MDWSWGQTQRPKLLSVANSIEQDTVTDTHTCIRSLILTHTHIPTHRCDTKETPLSCQQKKQKREGESVRVTEIVSKVAMRYL